MAAGRSGHPAAGGDSFVHLHVHTEYSMLDGAARLKDLFAECQRTGMPAIAMTDHGNIYGAYDFWSKANAAGVRPIIGIEAYVAPDHRGLKQPVRWGDPGQKDDDVSGGGAYTHMTLLAETTEGMHNIFRLASLASLEGYFRKPRMDRELLSQYAAGIIATTGCPGGEVQTRLRLGQYDRAVAAAAAYRDIFGDGNFFVEIMDHGLGIEQRTRDGLTRIARDLSLPCVVTNDSHYTRPEDARAHEVLLCVQTGTNLADPGRLKFESTGYYVKSPQEMRAASTAAEWQAGCDSTLLIAERAEVTFAKSNLMPRFPLPDGETEQSWLRKEVWSGMDRRYPGGYDEQRRNQAEYEIGVIEQMGFCAYFLVVADFIMWAKRNGIRVGPGRGSGAGSIVAYSLGITDLDPIYHGLVFERFLNLDRVTMPDFDIDFDERRRGDVIRYVTERYGDDRVAQIITYGTIKAKAAVKDSARVLGFPYALGDRITKAFPPAVMGKDVPLSGIFDPDHPRYGEAGEIRALYEAEPEVKQVLETARGLEGLIRQAGVHAAGVIMSSEPLAGVLGDTYGLLVYQEQVLACAQVLAGYSPGKADLLRKAMGKKKKEILDAEFEPFAAGMRANGYSEHSITTIWDVLVPFSDYAFNRAHASCYGMVAYWTAYLKANYPTEYMAALLTSVAGDKDKSALYLSECRRMGIKVMPPDVNTSTAYFTPVGTDVRFGMAAVRNVGAAVVESIVATRTAKGAFTSFSDFLRKVPVNVCNKRVIESLIKAGAFDSLGSPRRGMLMIHEQAIDAVIDVKRNEAMGQDSLFGDDEDNAATFDIPVPDGEWDKSTLLGFEREMLGLYVSDHPLLGLEHMLAAETDCSVVQLLGSADEPERTARGDRGDGQVVTLGGILSGVQRKVTRQGSPWAAATLEDLEGAIEVLFFPATYQACMHLVVEDTIVFVRGRLDRREEVPKLVAMELKPAELAAGESGPFVVSILESRCVPPVVERLREVLRTHPGALQVHLRLLSGSRGKVLKLDDKLRVRPSPSLVADLKQLLGPACLG